MKKEIEDRFKAVVEMFEQLDRKLGKRDLFENVMKDEAEYKLRNLTERVEKLEAMADDKWHVDKKPNPDIVDAMTYMIGCYSKDYKEKQAKEEQEAEKPRCPKIEKLKNYRLLETEYDYKKNLRAFLICGGELEDVNAEDLIWVYDELWDVAGVGYDIGRGWTVQCKRIAK